MQKCACIADCLVADCIWLQIEFGCRLHLVTDCIWLQLLRLVISEVHCTVIFQFSGAVGSFDKVESVDLQKGMVYSLYDIFI